MVEPDTRDIIVCKVDLVLWMNKYKEIQTCVMIRHLGDAKRPSQTRGQHTAC